MRNPEFGILKLPKSEIQNPQSEIVIMRRVVLYIATSLDGYIAKPDGGIEWLSVVDRQGEDYGYGEFIRTIDTVILGRKTFDMIHSKGIEFPHRDKKCYVITRQEKPPDKNIIFYHDNIAELVCKLKSTPGKNIFCDGGAEIVNSLMRNDLIDDYIISVIPVFLGKGLRLFDDYRKKMDLKLIYSKSFASGLVQSHYRRIHNN